MPMSIHGIRMLIIVIVISVGRECFVALAFLQMSEWWVAIAAAVVVVTVGHGRIRLQLLLL